MNRNEKAKWFFLGMGAGWLPIIAVAVLILFQVNSGEQNDPFGEMKPDLGERVYQMQRPATGVKTIMQLGLTDFVASVGPSRYQDEDDNDWDFYTISVEKQDGDALYVFFERQFRIEEIPTEIIRKEASDITVYDEESGVVTFTLGTSKYTYKLPTSLVAKPN